jgi:AcrR family transcriptional regulator
MNAASDPVRAAPASLRQQQRRFTSERLIASALACFARTSYAETTVEEILAEAGAGRATFYGHFAGKSALLACALDAYQPVVEASYQELNDRLGDPAGVSAGGLRAWLAGWADRWEEHAVMLRAVMQAGTIEPDLQRRHLEVEARLADLLSTYLERHRDASCEMARVKAVLLQMMTERAFYTMISSVDFDRELALDALSDYWVTTLVGAPPAPRSAARADATA